MRKMTLKLFLLGLGMAFSVHADAQSQLGGLLKNVLGGTTTTTTTDDDTSGTTTTTSVLSSLFQYLVGTSSVSNSSLKGDWSYESPAVAFESESLLKKAGGSLMASTAEKTLQGYLEKVGFEAGKVLLSFDGSETFTMTIGSKSFTGTYTVSDNEITFQRQGLLSTPVTANLALQGSSLQITFEADKLLEFLTKISSLTGSSTMNLISSIAGSYDGMQLGFQFTKQ